MAAPIVPIIIGVGLIALASKPRRASAAPVSTTPPKVPPPGPPSGTVVNPPGVPGGAMPTTPGGIVLPGGIPWPYGTSGGVASCPPGPVSNTPVSGLPSPTRESVQMAMATATNADALEALANQLQFCGYTVAAAEVRVRVNELRAGGGPAVPGFPPPGTGGGPEPMIVDADVPSTAIKVQSDPNIQWRHVVREGEGPIIITERYFGPLGEAQRTPDGRLRWVELVLYNTTGPAAIGKASTGDPNNPYASNFNFTSLVPGEQIRVPKTWNAWISSDGYRRGALLPWPPASMSGGMA